MSRAALSSEIITAYGQQSRLTDGRHWITLVAVMSTHTPGPWRTIEGSAYEVWTRTDPVADVLTDNVYDARLIATAPELLEACKMALPYLSEQSGMTAQDESVFSFVKVVIAKAEGSV